MACLIYILKSSVFSFLIFNRFNVFILSEAKYAKQAENSQNETLAHPDYSKRLPLYSITVIATR
jgi:hypothetical protein